MNPAEIGDKLSDNEIREKIERLRFKLVDLRQKRRGAIAKRVLLFMALAVVSEKFFGGKLPIYIVFMTGFGGSAILDAAANELSEYQKTSGPVSEQTRDAVKEAISIKVESEHTFTVAFDGTDPNEVAKASNVLSTLFVDHASAKSAKRTEDTQSIIQNQLDALKARLAAQD